jgi:hypothetical protein
LFLQIKINDFYKVGAVCNNAEIVNSQLRGQPTEGALLSLALKVSFIISNFSK